MIGGEGKRGTGGWQRGRAASLPESYFAAGQFITALLLVVGSCFCFMSSHVVASRSTPRLLSRSLSREQEEASGYVAKRVGEERRESAGHEDRVSGMVSGGGRGTPLIRDPTSPDLSSSMYPLCTMCSDRSVVSADVAGGGRAGLRAERRLGLVPYARSRRRIAKLHQLQLCFSLKHHFSPSPAPRRAPATLLQSEWSCNNKQHGLRTCVRVMLKQLVQRLLSPTVRPAGHWADIHSLP